MKFKISKIKIQKILENINLVINSGNALPILTCVKITVEDNIIRFVGINNPITIQKSVYVEEDTMVFENGECVCSCKLLYEICKHSFDDYILFEKNEAILWVKATHSEFRLNVIDPDDFPQVSLNIEGDCMELNAQIFKTAIHEVSYAASVKDGRPELNGVRIVSKRKQMDFIATDSYRICIKHTELDCKPMELTIPTRALDEVCRNANLSKTIKIFSQNNSMLFLLEEDQTLIKSQLIANLFPDISGAVKASKNSVCEMVFEKNDLLKTLHRISILDGESKKIKIEKSEGLKVFFSSDQQEVGHAEEVVNPINCEGEISIYLNSKYLIDYISHFPTEVNKIQLNFNGFKKPIVVSGLVNKEKYDSLQCIMMPFVGL